MGHEKPLDRLHLPFLFHTPNHAAWPELTSKNRKSSRNGGLGSATMQERLPVHYKEEGMRTASLLAVLGLAILMGWATTSPGESQDVRLAITWEYKVVTLPEDAQQIEKTFNALSGQGWEYAGSQHYRAETSDCAIFRRPKR